MKRSLRGLLLKTTALLLALCLLPAATVAEGQEDTNNGWVTFLLLCNEGMNNSGGNAGNTMMAVAMNPKTGKIRLAMLTWDTFIDYEGYDVPQRIDMPYRKNGPEEALKVFNANFGMDIDLFMSLNYLNLASLIDDYGGVTIDISRAERNALNGMVASKKENIKAMADSGLLSQLIVEMLAEEYYLTDFGPDTHLNGLQAVGYGWLQYDSVYNCCVREVMVVANLFESVGTSVAEKIIFYTNDMERPDDTNGRHAINLDNVTEADYIFIRRLIDPIFQMTYNNLSEEEIHSLSLALARIAYEASREGLDIFGTQSLEYMIFPLEAKNDYEIIAGSLGHLVDKETNSAAMKAFLFREDN